MEWPHLSGAFGSSEDARLFADGLIVSASADQSYVFINVFQHHTSRAEDTWRFFNSIVCDNMGSGMMPDEMSAEAIDIFLELIDHESGSNIVTLLSESRDVCVQIAATDPSDFSTLRTLNLQCMGCVNEARELMFSIVGT